MPLMGGATSPPHGELLLLQRLLPPEMNELPYYYVHKPAKIAHHTHTAAAQLLADKEVAEGDDGRGSRGEGIRHPPRTLLLGGNNRPQRGGGGRRIQRWHWDGRRHILVAPSHALLLCFLLPT